MLEKKNAIILVLPFKEISLRPELSSPPRFRIQGGYPERDTAGAVRVAGRYFPFLIMDKSAYTSFGAHKSTHTIFGAHISAHTSACFCLFLPRGPIWLVQ